MISQTRADNRNDHNDHNDCVASAQELRNVTQKTSFEKKKTRQRHRGSTILTNDQTPLKKKRTHKNKQKKECDFWMLRSCYSCSWESSKNRITIITMSPWHVTLPFVSAQLHSFGLAAWDSWQRGRMI